MVAVPAAYKVRDRVNMTVSAVIANENECECRFNRDVSVPGTPSFERACANIFGF